LCSYNPNAIHSMERDAVSFQVVDRSERDGVRGPWAGNWPGVLRPMLEWKIETSRDGLPDSLIEE
jgi:lipopolysaccharide transport system ATP-binding protein